MKKLLLTLAVLLGFALPGLAEVTKVASMPAPKDEWTGTNQYSGTINSKDDKWSAQRCSNNDNVWTYFRLGNKNEKTSPAIIKYLSPVNEAISSIKVNVVTQTKNSGSLNSITVNVYDDSSFQQLTSSYNATVTSTGWSTVTITEPLANKYYEVCLNLTIDSKSGVAEIDAIEFYGEATASGPVDLAKYVTYSSPSLDLTAEDAVTAKEAWSNAGIIVQYMLDGVVAKNTECTEKAVMTFNGSKIGDEMGINDDFVIVGAYGAGGFAEGDASADANDFVIVFMSPESDTWSPENGLYEMTIPAGFFTIDGKPINEYKAQWRVGGEDFTPTFTNILLGVGETFDANTVLGETHPEVSFAIESGNEFVTAENGVFTGVTSGSATVKATWNATEGIWNAGEATFEIAVKELVKETLTRACFGKLDVTNTAYAATDDYTSEVTGITYKGFMSLGNHTDIQLRKATDKAESGIVSVANPNGYILSKVDFTWGSQTGSDRTFNLYLSDEPYTVPADLHADTTTPFAQVTRGTGPVDATFGPTDPKMYVGFRANKDPQYISSITLYWIKPDSEEPTKPECAISTTDDNAEYTDIEKYGHNLSIVREEGVEYTYKLNDQEVEKDFADDVLLTPYGNTDLGYATINTVTVIARKGEAAVESEKSYFLTHPYIKAENGKIALYGQAPAEHGVKIYYNIIDNSTTAFRATRAEAMEYTEPVELANGQKIQYWAEAAHPAVENTTLKSAVVTNSLNEDGTLVGVDSIEADENAPVEFYTIDGVRVAEPENGLYIVRQGNKVYKVIIRK